MALRIVIVHEHLAYAQAIQMIVDAEEDLRCVGMGTAVEPVWRIVERERPDVVLLDLDLAHSGSLPASELRARVVAMTSEVTLETFEQARRLGAAGLVGKDAPLNEVLGALRCPGPRVTVSGTTLELLLADARGWLDLTTKTPDRDEAEVHLTRREREVLTRMQEGLDAKRMALDMHVSVHTARSHIKKVLAKLGAHSQLEAVAIANRLNVDVGGLDQ